MNLPKRLTLPFLFLGDRILGKARHVPLGDMVRLPFQRPWRARAERHIDRVEDAGAMLAVFLRGRAEPLYWPKEYSLDDLRFVLLEQLEQATGTPT